MDQKIEVFFLMKTAQVELLDNTLSQSSKKVEPKQV